MRQDCVKAFRTVPAAGGVLDYAWDAALGAPKLHVRVVYTPPPGSDAAAAAAGSASSSGSSGSGGGKWRTSERTLQIDDIKRHKAIGSGRTRVEGRVSVHGRTRVLRLWPGDARWWAAPAAARRWTTMRKRTRCVRACARAGAARAPAMHGQRRPHRLGGGSVCVRAALGCGRGRLRCSLLF